MFLSGCHIKSLAIDGKRETTSIKGPPSPELSPDWKVLGEGLVSHTYITPLQIPTREHNLTT